MTYSGLLKVGRVRRHRRFESGLLQRRVSCEPDAAGGEQAGDGLVACQPATSLARMAQNMYVDAGCAAAGKRLGKGRPALGGNTLVWRAFGKCGEITPQICQARNFGAMITAAQCRSARTLLSWSLNKLASAASVPADVIDSFEMERQRPDAATMGALQRAFEDVGVEFLPDDDVRVRAATPPDK